MKKSILSLAVLLLLQAAAFGGVFYVTMDTTAINGNTGTIDLQFNPGSFPASYEPGSVTITNFIIDGGTLGPVSIPGISTTGGLPGPLTIENLDFLNGIAYDATFGSQVTFFAEFLGNAFTAGNQTNLNDLIVTLSGDSSITARITLLGDSAIDYSLSSTGVGVSEVPEPGTFGLLALACGAALGARRFRKA